MVNDYEYLRNPFQAVRILPADVNIMLQSRVPTQAKEYPKALVRFRSTQVKMLDLSEDAHFSLRLTQARRLQCHHGCLLLEVHDQLPKSPAGQSINRYQQLSELIIASQ